MGLCAHIDDDDFLATACLHKICLPRSMRNSKGQQQQNQQAADREDRKREGERGKKGRGRTVEEPHTNWLRTAAASVAVAHFRCLSVNRTQMKFIDRNRNRSCNNNNNGGAVGQIKG